MGAPHNRHRGRPSKGPGPSTTSYTEYGTDAESDETNDPGHRVSTNDVEAGRETNSPPTQSWGQKSDPWVDGIENDHTNRRGARRVKRRKGGRKVYRGGGIAREDKRENCGKIKSANPVEIMCTGIGPHNTCVKKG